MWRHPGIRWLLKQDGSSDPFDGLAGALANSWITQCRLAGKGHLSTWRFLRH
jgi:hypothetical protein